MHDLDLRRDAGALLDRECRSARSRESASRRSPATAGRGGSRACRASGSPPGARARARAFRDRRSRRAGGRNSCSGGSSSRIVTGSPAIASKIPSKSACCIGSRRVERGAALGLGLRQDHLADDREPVVGHEHVLGPAEPDALGAVLARARRVGRRVGVGMHAERAQLVCPLQDHARARDSARARRAAPRRRSRRPTCRRS